MLMDMWSPKFDVYQGTVAPNCFKSHTNSQKVFSDVRSEIHFVRSNIVSNVQSFRP